ncbi:hypothetical protein DMUE_6411, partial [Dictyocoela muelleri]
KKNTIKCTRNRCRKEQTFLVKPPFFHSNLSFMDIVKVIFHLVNGDKIKNIYMLYGIDKKSIMRILKVIGMVCEEYNRSIKIGGTGIIVEVDESKFGKRKYNRGHRVNGSWILGGVERGGDRKIFLDVIERRNAIILEEVIRRRINEGSIIYTDAWRGYSNLNQYFEHYTVNHSVNFVDN